MNFESMSIDDLDKELDRRDALRLVGEAYNRAETEAIMSIRNQKIAAESLHQRMNPTPIVGLPNEDRLNTLRVRAGVAIVGVKAV